MSESTQTAPEFKTLSITPGKLSPGFSSGRKHYTAYIAHDIGSVQLSMELRSPDSTLTLNGAPVPNDPAATALNLQVGRNMFALEVTSHDGKMKNNYTVKVIRSYPTPTWVRASEKSPWIPRDSAGELVFKDRLWLFGGYTPELVNDVWSSRDGVEWTRTGNIPCESGINIPVTFEYGGRMWVMSQAGKLFSSEDGASWDLVTEDAPWKGRYSAGAVVFKGRMWVLGGSGGGKIFNDVWSSTDGVHWTLETEEAPWSKRQLSTMAVVHAGKIWVLGGGITVYHPFRAYRDVWNSEDGKNWGKVTDCAPWPVRIWSSSAVYKNRLWVFSGFRAEPTWNNFNDVWFSPDGANWTPLVTEAIWSQRHEVSPYVFDGKLWVIGGNAWPLMNDSWYLQIDGLTFLTQPVIEEFVTAHYAYQARADFNESGQKVRYRLVDKPDWLGIDAETGLIQGTPPAVTDVPVTIEAYDEAGETARQSYTLHVLKV